LYMGAMADSVIRGRTNANGGTDEFVEQAPAAEAAEG
jgi:small subunit ribosomal protein S2